MAEHPIQGLMNVTMEKIHQMVDSNTIIGKPSSMSCASCRTLAAGSPPWRTGCPAG